MAANELPSIISATGAVVTDFAGIQALTSRSAGYAVAQKCLEVQAAAELREPHLRTDHRVVLHDDAWPWYTGAIGEIEVGRMLTALGPEWFVHHSIPIGAGTKDAASRTRADVPRASKRGTAGSRKPTSNSGLVGVVKVWLFVAFVIAITLILRGFAYQPCSAEALTGCMAGPFYLGLKPLLVLLAVGSVAVGAMATIVRAVRRAFR